MAPLGSPVVPEVKKIAKVSLPFLPLHPAPCACIRKLFS
jgi:hypothetical protein